MQIEESPRYGNVFICFGAFHITLVYFAGIGFVLAESVGTEILVETEVLASGSLNGFLAGKHYNRCKRLHPLFNWSMKQSRVVQMNSVPIQHATNSTS